MQTLSDDCAADAVWKLVAKGDIAHDDQFTLLPLGLQLFTVIIPSALIEVFGVFYFMFSKSSVDGLLHVIAITCLQFVHNAYRQTYLQLTKYNIIV